MVELFIFLFIAGVVLWLAKPYIAQPILNIILALIIICAVIGILQVFGFVGPIGSFRFR